MADRKNRIFGSRLQTKLVIFSVLLVMFPVFTMYFMSATFIKKTVDRWFDEKVSHTMRIAMNLTEKYKGVTLNALTQQTALLADLLGSGYLVGSADSGALVEYANDYINKMFPDGAALYWHGKMYTQQNLNSAFFRFITDELLNSILDGQKTSGLETETSNPYFWCGVPIKNNKGNISGALFTFKISDKSIVDYSADIKNMNNLFRQLRFYSQPVSAAFNVTQFLVALLVIFACIWGSIIFVRSITVQLKALATAAGDISKGKYDTEVEVSGNDEITLLSKSFNEMASKLNRRTLELQRKNSALNEALNQISKDKKYIDTIYKNVDSGLVLLDKSLNMLKANDYAEDLIKLVSEKDKNDWFIIVKDFAAGSEHDKILQGNIHLKGERHFFTAHLNKILDAEGKLENIILVVDDNTHIMKLQRIMLWKEVATRITHEIKNPLTPIKLTAERVKRRSQEIPVPNVKELVDKSMETIITEVDELLNMAEEFNMYARPPSIIRSDIDLLSLVQDVVSLQKRARQEVMINVDIPSDIIIKGDYSQLKRMLVNLIQNSMQAIQNDGKIDISASVDHENALSLIISDNGCGIKEEDRDNIFVPYFSKSPNGTGLGLAIVKKIIEEHGGNITLESKAGEFTTFHIHLT
jgi:two-component system nitrogen regulation sensor histidine kinase NtrY